MRETCLGRFFYSNCRYGGIGVITLEVDGMYTIFAQPKYPMGAPQVRPIGYELFIKERRNGQWAQPLPFEGIGVMTLNHLLRQTITQMPAHIKILSFNLEQSQFIDPAFPAMIASVNQH